MCEINKKTKGMWKLTLSALAMSPFVYMSFVMFIDRAIRPDGAMWWAPMVIGIVTVIAFAVRQKCPKFR